MSLCDIRYPAPDAGRSCWRDPLKPHAKTDPGRLTRKNIAFLRSLPLALVPVCDAFGLLTLAGCARGRHLLTSLHCQAQPVLSRLPDRVDECDSRSARLIITGAPRVEHRDFALLLDVAAHWREGR
jgi:hypothetical protein